MRPGQPQMIAAMRDEVRKAQVDLERIDIPTLLDGLQLGLADLVFQADQEAIGRTVRQGRALVERARGLLGRGSHTQGRDDIDAVLKDAAAMTAMLLAAGDQAAMALVQEIVDWELAYYDKRAAASGSAGEAANDFDRLTPDNVRGYLTARRPEWTNLTVTSFKQQPGGYSKITLMVGLRDDANGSHDVVIRAQPRRLMLDLDGMSIAAEYPVVRYAFEAGLPVAEPLLLEEDPAHIGFPFMLSRRMPGAVTGSFTGATTPVTQEQVRAVLRLAAQVANTPVDPNSPLIRSSHLSGWLGHRNLRDNTRAFIEYWRDVGTRGNSVPSPLLSQAVHWLLENVPDEDGEANLIHGDIGFHNILFHEGRISALLDWENSRVGDTAEELSMFVSSIAHLFDHQTILRWFEEEGGPPVSEYRLRYFDVYMAMKIIVSAQVSLQRVEEGPEGNLRLGVFGIRYLPMIGSRLRSLIDLAEDARARETVRAV